MDNINLSEWNVFSAIALIFGYAILGICTFLVAKRLCKPVVDRYYGTHRYQSVSQAVPHSLIQDWNSEDEEAMLGEL